MHDCKEFVLPKSNLDYWLPKLEKNKQRDEENIEKLKSMGWNVIVVWECYLKNPVYLEQLKTEILNMRNIYEIKTGN